LLSGFATSCHARCSPANRGDWWRHKAWRRPPLAGHYDRDQSQASRATAVRQFAQVRQQQKRSGGRELLMPDLLDVEEPKEMR